MTTEFRAIRPDTLRSQVENMLRDAIMAGQLQPGARLVERDLCERLQVSRTSIREALRKLEAEKLVTIIPHKGPMVATISSDDVRDLYAIRALLEGAAARGFAEFASDDAIREFGEAVRMLRAEATAQSQQGVLDAKSRLYDVLLMNCGNSLMREVLNGLYTRINLLRTTSLMASDRLPASLREIDKLFRALKARDAAAAEAAARTHVQNAQLAAMKVLETMKSVANQ